MPTVPQYEVGQVQSRGFNATQRINVSDDAFGGNVARAQGAMGAEIGRLSDIVFKHELRIRDEYDKGVLREMDNDYSAHIRDRMGEFSQLNGRSASDSKQQYIDGFNQYRKDLAKDLDPRLKNSWGAMADARDNNAFNSINRHAVSQTIAYNKAQREARIANQQDEMAANIYDDKAINAAKAVGLKEIKDKLKDMGINEDSPRDDGERDIIAQARLSFTSKGHEQVINNLLAAEQGTRAQDYFDDHKDEIDPNRYAALETTLKAQTTLKRAQRATDEIMGDFSLSYAEQLAEARKIEDPSLRKETVALVKNRQAEIETLRGRSEDEAYDQAQVHIVAGGNKANMAPGVWESMSGAQQRTLKSVLDARVENALKPKNPIAAKQTFYTLEDFAHTNYEDFKKLRLDAYVGLMDEADIKTLRTLQKSHTAVKSSLSRKEQMKMVLGSMNMDFANFEKDTTSGKQVRAFIDTVDTKVAAFVATKNRDPDDQEYTKILLDIRANEAYTDDWGIDDPQSLGTMTEDQLKDAYVVVNGEDVYLSEIPEIDRANIIQEMKSRGIPVTAKAVAQHWMNAKQQSKK